MRFRIFRYMGGIGASTSVRIPGILASLLYFLFCLIGVLAIIGFIYAIWPQL